MSARQYLMPNSRAVQYHESATQRFNVVYTVVVGRANGQTATVDRRRIQIHNRRAVSMSQVLGLQIAEQAQIIDAIQTRIQMPRVGIVAVPGYLHLGRYPQGHVVVALLQFVRERVQFLSQHPHIVVDGAQ